MPTDFSPDVRRVFDPEMIARMQTALDAGWNALHSSESELASEDRREATRLLLATRIVGLARAGETKYGQLLMGALDGLIDPVTPGRSSPA